MYKVTIGMPIYNSAAYVEQALLSALNQTFPDIEYIIVDDRGTDNSMEIVRRVISEHPRGKDVRIIVHEVNKGLGVARDTMIANATAPYIYFMDSDDEISEDAIALLYGVMEKSGGAQVVQGERETIPAGGRRPDYVDRSAKSNIEKEGAEIVQAYFSIFTVVVWNKLYELDFLRKEGINFGGFRLGEDFYFSFLVSCKSNRYIYVPHVTYFYYENAFSLSADFRDKTYDETRRKANLMLYGKILDYGLSLDGEVRLAFEQKILELFYVEHRYVCKSRSLSGIVGRKYLKDLDILWHPFPFRKKYRKTKTKILWAFYRLPLSLRMLLVKLRNLLV